MSEQPNANEKPDILSALAEPFAATEVKFKPAVISGNRALALGYVDARVIQDRLDDVMGVEGWQDDYECREDGSVICRLRLRLGGEWVQKVDVGGPSEQPDGGDRLKAAFSDALKRAAVKFGVGRYLYRLPQQWVDYDAQKRQFARTPTLPARALPGSRQQQAPAQAKPLTGVDPAPHGLPVQAQADAAEAHRLVGEIDPALRRNGKLWLAALRWVGVNTLRDGWPEPVDAADARARVAAVATVYQLRRLAQELAPKGKQQQAVNGAA